MSRSSGLCLFGRLEGPHGLTRSAAPSKITLRIDRVRSGWPRSAGGTTSGHHRPAHSCAPIAFAPLLPTSVPRPTPPKKEVATWATTPRRWAASCAPSDSNRACRCTGSSRSRAAAGRRSWWAPTSVVTVRSPSRSWPSSPTSTACRWRSCFPRAASRRDPSPPRRSSSTWNACSALPADKVGPLARYAAAIQSQRGDYNGKVLSIRAEDLRSLAIIYDKTPGELTDQLIDWGVLLRACEAVAPAPEARPRPRSAWRVGPRRGCAPASRRHGAALAAGCGAAS